MKRGHSYNSFTDKEKPNHPLVKAFKKKGVENLYFIYAPTYATDSGWTIESTEDTASNKSLGDSWWGYTIESVKKNIEKAKFVKAPFGEVESFTYTRN